MTRNLPFGNLLAQLKEALMSKKKPNPSSPPKPQYWIYFVSYTAVTSTGNFESRREVKLEKSIRSIEDIDRVEQMIADSYGAAISAPKVRTVVIRSFQYLRNEPMKIEAPAETVGNPE